MLIRFAIHGIVTATWVSRIPAIKAGLSLSDGVLGVSLLGMAVGSLPAIPLCGWVIGRIGSKRACAWTSAAMCAALPLPSLSRGAAWLFASLVVFGAAAAANDVAMNAQGVAVEKLFGQLTMSRFHAMFSAGGILGSVAGGLAASGGVTPLWHFLVAAALALIVAVATAPMMLDRSEPCQAATPHRLSLRHAPATLLVLSGVGFCIFLSEGAIADWTAVFLKQVLGAGPGLAASGYAVFSAAMSLFRLMGDAIATRLGAVRTIRVGGLLAACGLASALLAGAPLWAMPGFAIAGAGFSSIIPLVFAASGRVSSVSEGAGVATVSGLGYLGFLAGPPLIGWISQMSSLRAGLGVVVALSALAALLAGAVENTKPPENAAGI